MSIVIIRYIIDSEEMAVTMTMMMMVMMMMMIGDFYDGINNDVRES